MLWLTGDPNDTSLRYWAVWNYFGCGVQSVLCVATDWTVRDLNTGRNKRAFFCSQRPDKVSVPTSLLLIVHWDLFTQGLSSHIVIYSTTLNLLLRLWMNGAICLLSLLGHYMVYHEQIAFFINYLIQSKITCQYQLALILPCYSEFNV
jgi:hypothetical protein